MKIIFKTREEKRSEYNKKNYVWKKTFLFLPKYVWFIQMENSKYQYSKKRSILWLCLMEKRTYIDSVFNKIIQYRECNDEDAETNGYYRNCED